MKSGIVEPEETVVGRQRLCKNFATATNTDAIIRELLDAVFALWYIV
jgi:hypothetical protein